MMQSNFKVEDNSYEQDFGSAQEVYENCMNVGGINSGVKLNSVGGNTNSTPQSAKSKSNGSLSASGNQKLSSSTPNLTEITTSSSNVTTKPRKSSFNQKNLELHLTDSQRSKIEAILNSVKELSDTEKLLLYLKLPTREHDTPATTNSKQEQTFAFQWIRNNLEECDNSVNLPKHEVYDEYRAYCEAESLTRFLSAPDFGKIVKCIHPNVKARRLGTRGNSKYCYNGLRRKLKQDVKPDEPSINAVPENEEVYDKNKKIKLEDEEVTCDQTLAAASALICEWANKLLGRVFETLIGLAKFLVSGSYVSTKSMASFVVMSASEDTINKLNTKYSLETLNPPSSTTNKNQVIKSESSLSKPLSCFSKSKDKLNKQSNEVNSSCDGHRNKSMSNFLPHGAQIVPDMPSTNSDLIGDFSIDIPNPGMMKNKNNSLLSNKLNDKVSMDKHRNKNLNAYHGGNSSKHSNRPSSTSESEQAKRRKKRLEQLQKSSQYPNNELSLQAQLAMKDATGFDLQSSFSNYPPPVPQNNLNMQMQGNQYNSWQVGSSDVGTPDFDLNSFVEEEYDLVPNDQRCHTVPMARSKCFETDQSLTPNLGNCNNQPSMFNAKFNKQPHHKAKRNLFDMFNNNNSEANVPINSNNNDFFSNASLQNVPSVLPLSSKGNVERVVPTEPLKNIQGFSNVDMSQQDDDFSGIASNFYHVDGHELLKTCQPSDNWMNDWSNMTMPVMNFT